MGVVTSIQRADSLPFYRVPAEEMGFGSSFGNGTAWVTTGSDGRVIALFSTEIGAPVAGPLLVRYATARSDLRSRPGSTPLAADRSAHFEIHPAYQRRHATLAQGIAVRETIRLPRLANGAGEDPCVVVVTIDLENGTPHRHELRVHAFAGLSGGRWPSAVRARFDGAARAIFAEHPSGSHGTRFLAVSAPVCGQALLEDVAAVYDDEVLPPLQGPTEAEGERLAALSVAVDLEPGAGRQIHVSMGFHPDGPAAAAALCSRWVDPAPLLARADEALAKAVDGCNVLTPDRAVNLGCLWSKVNMLRVLAQYPQGRAFTNEPGVSAHVVVRDVAWFVYGCDHFLPQASRELLDHVMRWQGQDGKLPEYANVVTGRTEDYGLNVNDGTPLFVLALNHHARSTGDLEYLAQAYDAARRACDYLLSQRDDRGLVFCRSESTGTRGICSWRNVIAGYQVNGAVTEVNAECAAALRAMGHMAENLGRSSDARKFRVAARALTDAINEHLLDPERGLYLLNIDVHGRRRRDVTADQVFPVLFRVADDDTAFRVIRRLNEPDFWTAAGLRTLSRLDPLYEPTLDVGLMGGVWPGLTWWFAFAAARYHAELMVQALRNSFAHYDRQPRVYHTVPGQFSEWFDGESLINRGMRLSPWEPPRFLWSAVEGVGGLMVTPGKPRLHPLRPRDWKWTAIRRVWYHGRPITGFSARIGAENVIFTDTDFEAVCRQERFERDVTDRVRVDHESLHPVALEDDARLLVAVGSSADEAVTATIALAGALPRAARCEVSTLSSERGEWTEPRDGSVAELGSLRLRIEARGFQLLSLRRRD